MTYKFFKHELCKEGIDITFQQVAMAKSIGARTLSSLATLKDSPCHSTKLFYIARINSSIWTHEVLVNVNVWKNLIVAKPQLPVELFNVIVTTRGYFVNGCESL